MRGWLTGVAATLALLAVLSGLAACGDDSGIAETAVAGKLTGDETGQIRFESRDGYDFGRFDGASPIVVSGEMILPSGAPKGAAILSHGSGGRGKRQAWWAAFLTERGYAAFVLDHFSARGASSTVARQVEVSEQQMMADILHAAALLAEDPRFKGKPIAHMGWSKGATAGILASVDRFAAFAHADGNARIGVFIEFYPFCGVTAEGERTSRRLWILHGDADDWTPIAPCRDFVATLRKGGSVAALTAIRGGRHGFDSWSGDGVRTLANAVTVRDTSDACLLKVTEEGRTESLDGASAIDTLEHRGAYLKRCGARGVTMAGSPSAQLKIEALVVDLLEN